MRWTWGRDPGTCTTCGAALDRGTMWCGACGARTDGQPVVADEQPPADEVEASSTSGAVGRWVTGGLVLGVVAALVAAAALRPVPGEPLLGRAEVSTGVTATQLPPAGLVPAWASELPGAAVGWTGGGRGAVVADGLVRSGAITLDLATGLAVVASLRDSWEAGRHASRLVDGQLLVTDRLTGAVVSRMELPADLPAPIWFTGRSGTTTLVSGEHGTILVGDDGTLLAEFPTQVMHGFADDARDEPAAFPLRDAGSAVDFPDRPLGALELVAADDGRSLLRRALDSRTVIADVVGEVALIAATEEPGRNDTSWDVEVVDATDGTVSGTVRVASAEVPRLLGVGPDGGVLFAGRVGRTVAVWRVVGDDLQAVGEATTPTSFLGEGYFRQDSAALSTAALTGAGLVVLLDGGEVVARRPDGTVAWRTDADGVDALAADGGVVVLQPRDVGDPSVEPSPTVLLDADDGTRLATFPQVPGGWGEPWGTRAAAVVDGHVGVSSGQGWPGAGHVVHLQGSTWLDLASGERATVKDLFEPWAGDVGASVLSWRFHGIATDEASGERPVLTFERGDGVLQLVEDDGVHEHELSIPTDEQYDGFATEAVGASARYLAIWGQSWGPDDEGSFATYVVDRDTDELITVPGVAGTALIDDLLIGFEFDPDSWQEAGLVAVDVQTGERRWTSPSTTRSFEAVQRHDGELLLDGASASVTVRSVATGEVVWTHESSHELLGQRVLGASSVLVATVHGDVVALDRSTGEEVWRTAVGSPVLSLRGAGAGAVVGTLDGHVVVLDGRGEEVQRVRMTAPVVDATPLGDTVVVIAGGEVIGLRADGTGLTQLDEVPVPER